MRESLTVQTISISNNTADNIYKNDLELKPNQDNKI